MLAPGRRVSSAQLLSQIDIDPKFRESSSYLHFPTAILNAYKAFYKTLIVGKHRLRDYVCWTSPWIFPHCLTLTWMKRFRFIVCRLHENSLSMETILICINHAPARNMSYKSLLSFTVQFNYVYVYLYMQYLLLCSIGCRFGSQIFNSSTLIKLYTTGLHPND